jgi:hypothetical protein
MLTDSDKMKACSICGKSQPLDQFAYGNKENRSYCRSCNKADQTAYAAGGAGAARAFRERMRIQWKS